MTYQQINSSVEDGAPNYRFVFTQGSTEFAYTTEPFIVSDSIRTYTPGVIRPGKLKQTNELSKDTLRLEFPRDDSFAQLFLGGVPEQLTYIDILRQHSTDPDEGFVYYYKGRIVGASSSVDSVRIDCENIFTSLRRSGLRARYQKKCRHALYSTGCGIVAANYAITATVLSVNGSQITIDTIADSNFDSDFEDTYFTGGYLETTEGYTRHIVRQRGTLLRLIRPLPTLTADVGDSVAGAEVTLYPGCNKTRNTCNAKYGNILNYGGFPWIPSKNPFRNSVEGSIL